MGSARGRGWSFLRTARRPVLSKHSVGWGRGDGSGEAGKGSGKPLEGLRRGALIYMLKTWPSGLPENELGW